MNNFRAVVGLALISSLIFILELTCIRWFPAHVLYLTFFTNGVLLATFVGLSVGCLLADRPVSLIRQTPFWIVVSLVGGLITEVFRSRLERYADMAGQHQPEVVFFGAELHAPDKLTFSVPAELIFAIFFFLIAAVMVGPGQELGRAFARVPNRILAYASNLIGSLAGIGIFAVWSWYQLSPIVWWSVIAVAIGFMLSRLGLLTRWPLAMLTLSVLLAIPTSGLLTSMVNINETEVVWSPYYRINHRKKTGLVETNQIGHQHIESVQESSIEPYALPYLFARDLNAPPYQKVLIIGAGTGNDVARACQWLPANATIDAVEIDPVIQKLGFRVHPDKPIDDKRVTWHLADGRTFLSAAKEKTYDLVIFALIDSLVLTNSQSNLRLESYIYTAESFKEVRRVLNDDGLFVCSNFFRQTFVTRRLHDGIGMAFGTDPILLTMRHVERLKPTDNDSGMSIMINGPGQRFQAIRKKFETESFWYPKSIAVTAETKCGFSTSDQAPGDGEWARFRPTQIDPIDGLAASTDDWPFLYVRKPMIPRQNINGIVIMLLMSLGLYVLASQWAGQAERTAQPPIEWAPLARSFFLGVGFMLIETKAVVQMSLLYGSTWTVNSVVFAAVLVMSLLGSLIAVWIKPKNLVPYYAVLLAWLVVTPFLPDSVYGPVSSDVGRVVRCVVAFIPIAFAGIIFASTFSRCKSPDQLYAANVAGALVGGLLENASMLLGFSKLGLVAVGVYALSAWFGRRKS